ncbi:hypothetical protein HDE_00976 [Halotydeus destructor]|nr:hypothetical protein HDE_00976 [Halotydeus destructor]
MMVKLTENNYRIWSVQMKLFLQAKDLSGLIDGTWPQPEKTDEDGQKVWFQANSKALYFIHTSVDESIFEHIEASESATEAWAKLASVFQRTTSLDKLAATTAFHAYKYDGTATMAKHVSMVENMAKKMKMLGEHVTENYVVAKLLQGLPDRYAGVATGLSFIEEKDQTFKKVGQILVAEEARQAEAEVTEGLAVATKRLNIGRRDHPPKVTGQRYEKKGPL